jgi:hypothetical protein
MLALTAALFTLLELLAGQVIEPLLYGRSTGLSPVAIIVSASFWTWLWGAVGLVLATPLTVCLVVVGRHVDRLQFFDIMLGDQPPLTPAQIVYQRMLAGDAVEAAEQARAFLKEGLLEDYYDTILLNGLRLAASDQRREQLDEGTLDRILETVTDLSDDLASHNDITPPEGQDDDEKSGLAALTAVENAEAAGPVSKRWASPRSVICIPGSGKLDEAAAIVVARMLGRRGFGTATEGAGALSMSRFFSLDLSEAALICICYVDLPSDAKIHYAVRRVTSNGSGSHVMLALLGDYQSGEQPDDVEGAEVVAGSFKVVMEAVQNLVHSDLAKTARENGPEFRPQETSSTI